MFEKSLQKGCTRIPFCFVAFFVGSSTIPRMLSLRLQRVGRTHDPSYRIVATDSRSGPKTNKHVAILGHHDAIRKTTVIKDPEEVKKYLGYGAQVTDTLYNILVTQGIIEGKKKNVLPKKSPIVDEEALARAAEEQAALEAAAAAEREAVTQANDSEVAEETSTEASAEDGTDELTPEETPGETPETQIEEDQEESDNQTA